RAPRAIVTTTARKATMYQGTFSPGAAGCHISTNTARMVPVAPPGMRGRGNGAAETRVDVEGPRRAAPGAGLRPRTGRSDRHRRGGGLQCQVQDLADVAHGEDRQVLQHLGRDVLQVRLVALRHDRGGDAEA